MIEVAFLNRSEIRMGSPYNVCRIRLIGDWKPDLPVTDWRDVKARRADGNAIALARWNSAGNVPGFRIYVLDGVAQTVEISRPLRGCCDELKWVKPNRIRWKAFPDLKATYTIKGREKSTKA